MHRNHSPPTSHRARDDERDGSLVLSLDFELYWGVADLVPLDARYRRVLERARAAIPRVLELFARHALHATWATVGILFHNSRDEILRDAPRVRPSYRDASLHNLDRLAAVGARESDDPYRLARSLVRAIAATPHQELGTHTFSHYYCTEPAQNVDAFRADLEAALRAAARLGVRIESIAFPRHQIGDAHLAVCERLGVSVYRGTPRARAYAPCAKHEQTLFRRLVRGADSYANVTGRHTYPADEIPHGALSNVRASHYLRPYSRRLRLLEPLKLRRITSAMTHAARHGEVCHLWFHPEAFGLDTEQNMYFLARVAEHFSGLRAQYGMRSYTMSEQARVARTLAAPRDA